VGSVTLERPKVDPRVIDLAEWITVPRLRLAWALAREAKWRSGVRHDIVFHLCLEVGTSPRVISRWLTGQNRPISVYIHRLDRLFSGLIGEDWPEVVDYIISRRGGETNEASS